MNKKPLGALVALTATVTLGASMGVSTAFAADDSIVNINLLAITDFHGHLENASRVAQFVKSERAAHPDTLLVGNGDLVGGSAYISAVQNDDPTLEAMNQLGVQASSCGNHEFDKLYSDFEGRIAKHTTFPWVCSNVAGMNRDVFKPYNIITTGSGIKVAFVGGVTADLPNLVNPSGLPGAVSDPIARVNQIATELKDGDTANGEADVVVALIHEDNAKIAEGLNAAVDVAIAGHTHTDSTNETASQGLVFEPGSYGVFVAKVNIPFNKTTRKVVRDGSQAFHNSNGHAVAYSELGELDFQDKLVGANVKVGSYRYSKETEQSLSTLPSEDPQMAELVKQAKAVADEKGRMTVGTIKGSTLRGDNGDHEFDNRGTESVANNLIAQSFYSFGQTLAKKPDFGVMNAGGVRSNIDANNDGVITFEESNTTQPFLNAFATLDLTGSQIYTMLEQQWKPGQPRPVLNIGLSNNVQWFYDVDAEQGRRVKQVFIDGKLVPNDDSRTYTVASNNFFLAGGDSFTVLKEGKNYFDTGLIDNAAFNEYLKANPDLLVDWSQRSISVSGEDHLVAGQQATLKLASLTMTSGTESQPLPKQVKILLGGHEVATADIDTIPTPNVNETGQATVTFTVPADLSGATQLTVVAGPTKASMDVNVSAAAASGEVITPEPTAATPVPTATPATAEGGHVGSSASASKHALARTGSDGLAVLGLSLALLVAGGAGLTLARKRA